MFIKLIIDKETRKKRIKVCESCDQFTKCKFCKSCGCYMPLKTYLKSATCPKNKWTNIFNSWS